MNKRKSVLIMLGFAVASSVLLFFALRTNDVKAPSATNVSKVEDPDKPTSTDSKAEITLADKSEETIATTERYINLSEFNTNKNSYENTKKVYFFHANWCYICQGIHNEITSDPSKIPANTTFIKTDFDSETALRKKYGVTTQYTFVQVDNDGNELKQWSATSLDKAIAGIL